MRKNLKIDICYERGKKQFFDKFSGQKRPGHRGCYKQWHSKWRKLWEKRKNIRRQRAPLGDQSGQTASFTQCTSGRVQMEPAWEGRHLGACRILNTGTHVSRDNRKVMVPWEDRTQICFREDRSSCAGKGGKGQQPEEPDQWGWSPVVKYRSISTPKKIMMLLDYNMLTREARIL